MIKTEFAFGEKILVSGFIIRERGINGSRFWTNTSHEPRPALFLNGTILANGTVGSDFGEYGESEGIYFTFDNAIKAAWICEYNRAPRRVFLSDCHKMETCLHKCPEHK